MFSTWILWNVSLSVVQNTQFNRRDKLFTRDLSVFHTIEWPVDEVQCLQTVCHYGVLVPVYLLLST